MRTVRGMMRMTTTNLADLYKSGWTHRQIAAHTGMTYAQVRYQLQLAGMAKKRLREPKQIRRSPEAAFVITMIEKAHAKAVQNGMGLSLQDICNQLLAENSQAGWREMCALWREWRQDNDS